MYTLTNNQINGNRNKYCYVCYRANTLGVRPQEIVCYKNWSESSQAMESDIIAEGFIKAIEYGIRYMRIIADIDSLFTHR